MNKRIRLLAAVLALCIALTLGLCGCTPKTESRIENAPAREGVSTYGAGENVAPDCVLRRPAAADADLNGRDAAWRPA